MNDISNEPNTHNGHGFVDLGLPSGLCGQPVMSGLRILRITDCTLHGARPQDIPPNRSKVVNERLMMKVIPLPLFLTILLSSRMQLTSIWAEIGGCRPMMSTKSCLITVT